MNKEELINSFESLTPSLAQKERMLANVLNAKTEKNVHKVSFNFRYAFSTAAAAVCVLAVVVAVGPMYKYHKISETSNQKVTTTETTDDKPVVKTETAETEDTVNTTVALPDIAAENKKAEQQPQTFTSAEAAPEAELPIIAEGSAEEYSNPMLNGRMLVMEDDAIKAYTPQLNINTINGGGGAAAPDLYTEGYEELTIDEYYDYLGFNVESILDIPDGFIKTSPTTNRINKNTDDDWYFEYKNGDSVIGVITTKCFVDTYSEQIHNNGLVTSDINGTPAVVLQTQSSYTAFIVKGNIGYRIDTRNVSEEELANLLLSIAG